MPEALAEYRRLINSFRDAPEKTAACGERADNAVKTAKECGS